jgi:hypothetical protein
MARSLLNHRDEFQDENPDQEDQVESQHEQGDFDAFGHLDTGMGVFLVDLMDLIEPEFKYAFHSVLSRILLY